MAPTLVIHSDYANCTEITSPFPHLLSHQSLSSAKLANKYFYIVIIDTGMDCNLVLRGLFLLLHRYLCTGCTYWLLNIFIPCSYLWSPDQVLLGGSHPCSSMLVWGKLAASTLEQSLTLTLL